MERFQVRRRDWIVFAVISVCSFLLFCHADMLFTVNHSYCFLNGRWADFYSACHEMTETYSANYLPLTYFTFALWNLPLKLLGLGPAKWGDWSLIFVYWNKLLPVLFYFGSAVLLYRMLRLRFGVEKQKSVIAGFLFLTMPAGFFSQFIFSQYDIFSIFFMLCGLYCYFSDEESLKNHAGFVLFFGIACSYKYFAVLFFIVFLFLREKRVVKILVCFLEMLIIPAVQFLFYYLTDRIAFSNAVMEFRTLDYPEASAVRIGNTPVNFLILCICFIGAMAYFYKPSGKKQLLSYGIFLSCGMICSLFTLMKWHPQWILIAVPFWTLGLCLNKNYKIFFWIEILFSAAFILFVVNEFSFNADQILLRNGLFAYLLQYSTNTAQSMADILRYQDKNVVFTILVVIMAVFFVYNHPRFHMKDFSGEITSAVRFANTRFLTGTLIFIIPALMMLPEMLHQPEVLWKLGSFKKADIIREQTILKDENIYQLATLYGDQIRSVTVYTKTDSSDLKKQTLQMTICDVETNEVIGTSQVRGKDISSDGESIFSFGSCQIRSGSQYRIGISALLGQAVPVSIVYGPRTLAKSADWTIVQNCYDNDYVSINGKKYEADGYHAVVQIEGFYKKPSLGILQRSKYEPVMKQSDGDMLTCNFNGDKITGSFEGNLVFGKPDGSGTFVQLPEKNPCRITGIFEEGVINGDTEAEYEDGTVISGKMEDGFWKGSVTVKEENGCRTVIYYDRGIADGHVQYYDRDGNVTGQDWYIGGTLLSELLEASPESSFDMLYADPVSNIGKQICVKGRITDLAEDGDSSWIRLEDDDGLGGWYEVTGGKYKDTGYSVCDDLAVGEEAELFGVFRGLNEFTVDPDNADHGKALPEFLLIYGNRSGQPAGSAGDGGEEAGGKRSDPAFLALIGEQTAAEGTVVSCELDSETMKCVFCLEKDGQRFRIRGAYSEFEEQGLPRPGETAEVTGKFVGAGYWTEDGSLCMEQLLEMDDIKRG